MWREVLIAIAARPAGSLRLPVEPEVHASELIELVRAVCLDEGVELGRVVLRRGGAEVPGDPALGTLTPPLEDDEQLEVAAA